MPEPAFAPLDLVEEPVEPVVEHGLPCPECGRTFDGAAGLGVHRSVKHGVKGKHVPKGSKSEERYLCGIEDCHFTSRTPQGVGRHRLHAHGIEGTSRNRPSSRAIVESIQSDEIVGVVLQQLFPSGIPVSKIRAVLEWAACTDHFMERLRE